MNRLEEIWQAFQKYKSVTETGSLSEGDFIAGAEWADENPRTDIIPRGSISHIRIILVNKFCDIAKKYSNCTIDEVPEMKEAFDMVDMFDKACEYAGYKFNYDKGIYEFK